MNQILPRFSSTSSKNLEKGAQFKFNMNEIKKREKSEKALVPKDFFNEIAEDSKLTYTGQYFLPSSEGRTGQALGFTAKSPSSNEEKPFLIYLSGEGHLNTRQEKKDWKAELGKVLGFPHAIHLSPETRNIPPIISGLDKIG